MAVGLGFLVVVALFAALIAPYFIDWTAYKRDFEKQASKIFGQTVTVGGEAQVRLLPLPSVKFSDLSVGKNQDGTDLMSIGEFFANVELMPFLSGEIKVVDMTLDRPTFNLKVKENGTIEWTNRKELKIDPAHVKLDKVQIRGGRIVVQGLFNNKEMDVSDIDASMTAKSLIGPWRIDGKGKVDNSDIIFDVSTGRLQDQGNLRLKLGVRRVTEPYRLTLDGTIGMNEQKLIWNGDFSVDPKKNSNADALTYSSKEPLPVVTSGKFLLNPNRLEVSEFRTDIGEGDDPFTITGKGSVNLLEDVFFKFQADGRQIDVDRIAEMQGVETTSTLNDRLAIFKSIIEQVPVPSVDGEIDFELPAIVAGDTVIREISAVINPMVGGWNVRRLNAKLPGSTSIEANGRIGLFEDFGFDGHLVIASRQPSGFASWAIGRVDPTIRRLTSGGLEADVIFTQNQTTFDNLQLLLDDNKLTGRLQRLNGSTHENAANTRDAMLASIKGDVVQVEDLQALFALMGGKTSNELSELDVDAAIVANTLNGFNLTGDDVNLQFRITSGELSISKLNVGSFYGAAVSSSGQIVDLLGKPKGNLKIGVSGEDATQLLTLLKGKIVSNRIVDALLEDPTLGSEFSIQSEIDASPSGQNSTGRILLSGSVGGTKLNSQIGFTADFHNVSSGNFDVSTDLSSDAPTVLLSQLGLIKNSQLNQLVGNDVIGPLNIRFESVGSVEAGFSTIISGSSPDGNVSAQGITYLKKSATGVQLSNYEMDVTAGFENALPYLSQIDPLLPDFFVRNSDSLSLSLKAEVAKTDDVIRITKLNSQLDGNAIDGELSYQIGDTGRPTLSGVLNMETLTVPNLFQANFGTNDGGIGDQIAGWSKAEFGDPLFAGADAKIELSAGKVDAGFGLMMANAKTTVLMRDGEIELNKSIAQLFGGQISGDVSINNTQGTGVVQGNFFAENISAGLIANYFGKPQLVDGKVRANGTFNGNGKSTRAIISSLSGSGIVELEEGVVYGVSAEGLPELLKNADAESFEIKESNVDPIIKTQFLSGTLNLPKQSSAYSISRGKMQIRNLVTSGANYKANFNSEISLLDGVIDTNLQMTIDPGRQKVSGASSEFKANWIGPINEMSLQLNSQGMQSYLSIRAFEFEQRRVELLQAKILEKQRLRRDIVKTNTRAGFREEIRLEQLRRQEAERQEALRVEQEAESARLAEEARIAQEAADREQQKQLQLNENELKLQESQKQGFKINKLPPAKRRAENVIKNIENLIFPQVAN